MSKFLLVVRYHVVCTSIFLVWHPNLATHPHGTLVLPCDAPQGSVQEAKKANAPLTTKSLIQNSHLRTDDRKSSHRHNQQRKRIPFRELDLRHRDALLLQNPFPQQPRQARAERERHGADIAGYRKRYRSCAYGVSWQRGGRCAHDFGEQDGGADVRAA